MLIQTKVCLLMHRAVEKKNHQKKENKQGKPESFLLMIWQRQKHTICLASPKIHSHCRVICREPLLVCDNAGVRVCDSINQRSVTPPSYV